MQPPKISALLPVYNTKEEYLRAALESVLNQTFGDFELLVYNDGSTDPNVEWVILSYDDPRIRYLGNEKNLGITGARNRLLDAASGEYLAVIDHDDISRPERFAEEAAFLDAHPDIGVVGTWVRVFPHTPEKFWRPPTDNETIEENLMYAAVIPHPSSMFRRSVFDEHKIRYEERFSPAEDYALFNALIGKTRFAVIPKVLLDYRYHRMNTSRVQKTKMRRSLYRAYAETRTDHPALWNRVQYGHTFRKEFLLFGFLPLLTFYQKQNKTKWYLFDFIPLLTTRSRHQE